jgi:hypothetical protein
MRFILTAVACISLSIPVIYKMVSNLTNTSLFEIYTRIIQPIEAYDGLMTTNFF